MRSDPALPEGASGVKKRLISDESSLGPRGYKSIERRIFANVCKLVAFGSKEPFLYPPLIKKLKYEKLSFLHLCPNAINLLLGAVANSF